MKHHRDLLENLKNVHEIVRIYFQHYSFFHFLLHIIDNLNEQSNYAYNSLINRCTSNSPSIHDEHSSSSLSSNQEKSDSHYSSNSSLNSKQQQPSITGQPLPPPPDLSSLGSKLTTATLTRTFQLPQSSTLNKYRMKSMNHLLSNLILFIRVFFRTISSFYLMYIFQSLTTTSQNLY